VNNIHPTVIISPKTSIGDGVTIGPYTVVKENVTIGDGCAIGAHVVLLPGIRLGKNCKVYHHAVLGEIPQDLKFEGEETTAEIGDNTTIREFVTINRGTKQHWKTVIGPNCFLMAYVHIAHDCAIEDNVIISNAVNLAGHVTIENWATIGGMTAIHQFVKIGQHSFIGGGYRVPKDVPPYILAAGEPLSYKGLNVVGLRRRGFSEESLNALKYAYKIIYDSHYNISDAINEILREENLSTEIRNVIEFVNKSERGIIR
jgi:UDP-N-acetylglucosamine acyltransferase